MTCGIRVKIPTACDARCVPRALCYWIGGLLFPSLLLLLLLTRPSVHPSCLCCLLFQRSRRFATFVWLFVSTCGNKFLQTKIFWHLLAQSGRNKVWGAQAEKCTCQPVGLIWCHARIRSVFFKIPFWHLKLESGEISSLKRNRLWKLSDSQADFCVQLGDVGC